MLYDFFTNEALIVPVCAWMLAQSLKVIIAVLQKKGLDFRYMVSSGGMPSAHSAVVCALATTLALRQGLGTAAFGISAILALVVMYDAAGIRQSVGRQSRVLNHIVQELRLGRAVTEVQLREFIGHTPFQVIVGGVLGVAFAWSWLAIAGL